MIGTLISSARKCGKFKNDKGRDIEYDNIILYVATPLETYKGSQSELSGYPVQLVEVKIPASKYVSISNIDYKDITAHHGEAVAVYYDMKLYDGKQLPVLTRVEF